MVKQPNTAGAGSKQRENEIDLIDLASFFLTKWLPIVLAFIIGGAAAFLYTWQCITPQYTATAKMYMVSSSTNSVVDLTDLNIGTSLSSDYVELIKTRPVLEDVIDELDLDYDYKQLSSMVSVSAISDTRIIKISVTSPDPEEAKDIANALAEQTEKTLPNIMDTPEPSIAEYAITPDHRSSPSYTKNTMMGAIALLVIMLIIFTIMYLMDDTIKSAEEVEREFGVMPLTVIPEADIPELADTSRKQRHRDRIKTKMNRRKSR